MMTAVGKDESMYSETETAGKAEERVGCFPG